MTRPRSAPRSLSCDVLVLGAGLAGLRAAWAARQADPALRVVVAAPLAGPSGSSFANRNNALGMQVPGCFGTDPQLFFDEALALAAPGLALPPLIRALAQDAPARLRDLTGLGLNFRLDANGCPTLFPGCFSTTPRAVIFDGLAQAHAAFLAKARSLGVELLPGFEALDIPVSGGRACGALLRHIRTNAPLAVSAGAVIAALGGPAPLFARRTCAPGSGLAYGLLARAGAELANAPFLQFFWVVPRTLEFINPAELDWSATPFPPELLAARAQHCPTAHGLPDSAVDASLLSRLTPGGLVHAAHRQRGPLTLALAAHAGNGGALIDPHGRTSTPGLYACGECATGMHGANRLGGGMVLATQVFGQRAGHAAATETAPPPHFDAAPIASDPGQAAFLRRLRRSLQHHALPGSPPAPRLASRLRSLADDPAAPLRRRTLALSALAVLGREE